MARYAEVPDLLAAWPRVHTSGLSHDEMRTMLDRASNFIDTEVCRRYTVPFDIPAPPRIRDLTVDLAMMDVLFRSADPPAFVQQRINWALEQLRRLANGEACLVDASGSAVSEIAGVDTITSNTSGYTPIFGAGRSLDERLDPNRLVDEAAARGVTANISEFD